MIQAAATSAFLLLLACVLPQVSYGQSKPEYAIREDQAKTGSNIRRQIVRSTGIAVNLPYNKLPEADREKILSNYEQIAPGDEPPFPLNGLKEILNPLHKAQESLLVRGDLLLVATIDERGEATEVKAYGSPSSEMTKFASQVLLLTRFKPAICSGQPCKMDFPFRMTFEIR